MTDKLRICGLEYIIKEDKKIGAGVMACVEFEKKQITLKLGMDPEYWLLCVLHETAHIIYREAGLSNRTPEETDISAFSNGFYNLLRENKGFFKKYLDKL